MRKYKLTRVNEDFILEKGSVKYILKKVEGIDIHASSCGRFILYKDFVYSLNSKGYYFNGNTRRKFLHRELWEDAFGKVKPGMLVHFVDGNNKNLNISNLTCVSRKENLDLRMNNSKLELLGKEVKCKLCGVEFKSNGYSKKKVCSEECWRRDYNVRRKQLARSKKFRNCETCGIEFEVVMFSYRRFCCAACRQDSYILEIKD